MRIRHCVCETRRIEFPIFAKMILGFRFLFSFEVCFACTHFRAFIFRFFHVLHRKHYLLFSAHPPPGLLLILSLGCAELKKKCCAAVLFTFWVKRFLAFPFLDLRSSYDVTKQNSEASVLLCTHFCWGHFAGKIVVLLCAHFCWGPFAGKIDVLWNV